MFPDVLAVNFFHLEPLSGLLFPETHGVYLELFRGERIIDDLKIPCMIRTY